MTKKTKSAPKPKPKVNHYWIHGHCYIYSITRTSLGPCRESKAHAKECPYKNKIKEA